MAKPVQVVSLNGFSFGCANRLAIREVFRSISLHKGFERKERKRERENNRL